MAGMTYARFLALFLVVPIVLSLAVRGPRRYARHAAALGLLLVFVYVGTIPWDSTAVARGLWSFDTARTWQVTVFGLPLEEVLFFGLQTVLTGLWVNRRLDRTFAGDPEA